jgi:hypothetical protein
VVEETRRILDLLGIDQRRLHLKWVSASEGSLFAEEIRSYTQQLKTLGRNPIAEKEKQASTAVASPADDARSELPHAASA